VSLHPYLSIIVYLHRIPEGEKMKICTTTVRVLDFRYEDQPAGEWLLPVAGDSQYAIIDEEGIEHGVRVVKDVRHPCNPREALRCFP
jgi:hypothetical protein